MTCGFVIATLTNVLDLHDQLVTGSKNTRDWVSHRRDDSWRAERYRSRPTDDV